MMLLPCFTGLRVADVQLPAPEFFSTRDAATAFFHKGAVVRLTHGDAVVSVVLAQQDQPSVMQCDDGLTAQFFGLQVTDDSEHPQFFGRIAAATAGLLTVPVGSMIALSADQAVDVQGWMMDLIADTTREVRQGCAA